MGDSRRPTRSHRFNAYCTVIVRVSYGYGYNRGSGRVWVEIFGAGRVRARVASSATGTGRVAEMVDLHTRTTCYMCELHVAYVTLGLSLIN